ncbi:MAG: ribonuclease R [Alphaproteobacteria bacterium]|nr:ribonuclease R [Alphaproteobacteria bacterium]
MPKKMTHLPTQDELIAFLNNQGKEMSKREIARNFGAKGEARAYLKHLLKEIEQSGLIQRNGRRFMMQGLLRDRIAVEITGQVSDGSLVGRPVRWNEEGEPPQILLTAQKIKPAPKVGDILQAKIRRINQHLYEGEALKRLSSANNQMVGVIYEGKIVSVDRRFKEAFLPDESFPKDINAGDIVLVEIPELRSSRPRARFIQKIGKATDAHVASLISIFSHHLPVVFMENSLRQAERAKLPALGKREDLRDIPFITIDGADAKDFDDAVFAQKDENEKNKGGFHIYVAIADVAWFVRYGTALDKDAFLRGNSTYFPDRVLPMLPEALSNGLCSLNPNEDRPAMVCELKIDKNGRKLSHRFFRAMIRSKARLTYDEVEADFIGKSKIEGLGTLIDDLKSVYLALSKARQNRGVLELDVPERQVVLNEKGQVIDIRLRQRYDSHKMIEELMILSNVAAAQTLERLKLPTMYRIHDKPSEEKLDALQTFLKTIGISLKTASFIQPDEFNTVLQQAENKKLSTQVNEMVLRTQSQAEYSPENIGHYGLSLDKYAHFTSPIRRYADIMVHRALISGLSLGEGGLAPQEAVSFEKIAEHISATERQSAAAEQDAIDRYVASYLADRVGELFDVRISSVTRFGVFVALDEYNADGLIPISALPDDYYVYDENARHLKGIHSGRIFTTGQILQAILKEAVPLTGGLLFVPVLKKETKKQKRFKKISKK